MSFSLILGSWELRFWNEPIGLIWVQVYGLYSCLLNSVWPNHFWPNASLELGSSWIRPNVNLTSSQCVWDKACSAWLDSFGIGPNLMTTFFLFPFFFFFFFHPTHSSYKKKAETVGAKMLPSDFQVSHYFILC